MDTKSVRPGTPVWWTVPQAIAWIVGRSELSVERVAGVRTLYTTQQRLLGVQPASRGDQPPISLDRAPLVLIQAARSGRLTIKGCLTGTAELKPAPVGSLSAPRLCDRDGDSCLEDNSPFANRSSYWKDLWVYAEECMNQWPAPLGARSDGANDVVIGGSGEQGQIPTYLAAPKYSTTAVPEQFMKWAEEQHHSGTIITVPMAGDAMRGPKSENGARRIGGQLAAGTGLSRETIRAWVKTLPSDWYAHQGVPPFRKK
jgi:hypothetical protein